jgi:hypothetical protein
MFLRHNYYFFSINKTVSSLAFAEIVAVVRRHAIDIKSAFCAALSLYTIVTAIGSRTDALVSSPLIRSRNNVRIAFWAPLAIS